MAKPQSELATLSAVAQLLAVILTVTALYFARDVFIPLALGVLLSFLLSPIVNRVQRWGVPNVVAVIATALLAFLLLAGTFALLGRELGNLVGDLPQHKEELVAKARRIAGMTSGVGGSLDDLAADVTEAIEKETSKADSDDGSVAPSDANGANGADGLLKLQPEPTLFQKWANKVIPEQSFFTQEKKNDGSSSKSPLYIKPVAETLPLASWATTAGTVLGPLATAGLVTVFTLFMLIHREDLRDRIIAVVSHGDYVTTTEALNEAANRISRYLIAQVIVNTSYGLVMSLGLALIGSTMTDEGAFPNAILWGVLATFLRFIPYLGPTLSAFFPLAIALSVFPGYSVFVSVLALIVVMELVSNNVLEPWLYGASTGISAVAVVVAAVFWGWLWGPVGLLLSTPLTVCLVVLGRYVKRFKMLSMLLGEEVEIKTSMRFYQRLLAGDEHRAREILVRSNDEIGFAEVCDAVLIPTLKRIRFDLDAEQLDAVNASRLFAVTGGLIADLKDHKNTQRELERQSPDATELADAESVDAESAAEDEVALVIGCPAHHFSETLVLNLLRTSGRGQYEVDAMDDETLPEEVASHIAAEEPAAVVIVVLPKGGFVQARYLCQSIRRKGFTGSVVIACLGKFKNYDKLFIKFRKAGATSMTTSYAQTHAKLESIIRDTNTGHLR